MRRILATVQTSIDGFMEGPGGEGDLGWMMPVGAADVPRRRRLCLRRRPSAAARTEAEHGELQSVPLPADRLEGRAAAAAGDAEPAAEGGRVDAIQVAQRHVWLRLHPGSLKVGATRASKNARKSAGEAQTSQPGGARDDPGLSRALPRAALNRQRTATEP
jgi:hypothetical protein